MNFFKNSTDGTWQSTDCVILLSQYLKGGLRIMLRIENLTKSYKKETCAKGLSLHVEAGDIYGLIGHNGAGKTTTMRAVIGALDFEEGDIFIDGRSIKDDPIYCKSVTAYIPDTPAPDEFLTGAQYLPLSATFSVLIR